MSSMSSSTRNRAEGFRAAMRRATRRFGAASRQRACRARYGGISRCTWSRPATRWPFARRACSRTPNTSRSRACTRRSCCPTAHPDPEVRLRQVIRAIQEVYASTYLQAAKRYIESHAVPAGRREDGRDPATARGLTARQPVLPLVCGRGAVPQRLPDAAPRGAGWDHGGRSGARKNRGGWRELPALLAGPSPAHPSVLGC